MIDYLKQYKDHLTFYLLYLYILGFAYYIFYYESFGIKIFTYLTLSEVLISSISFCVNILLFFILNEVIVIIISSLIKLFLDKFSFLQISITISIILILSVFFFFEDYLEGLNNILASMLLIQLLIKLFIIIKSKSNEYVHKKKALIYLSIVLFVVTIILFSVLGYSDYRSIVRGEYTHNKINIVTNDTIYSTIDNKSLYYIGETQLALFLYNMNDNSTIIVNRGNVKEIVITDRVFSKKQEDEQQKEVEEKVNKFFNKKKD